MKSTPTPIFPYTGGSWVLAAQQGLVNGTLSYTATTYGFTTCNYSINIRNKTYNYLGDPISSRSETDRDSFYKTNLLTKPILQRTNNSSGGFSYSPTIIFNAGNDRSTKTYYTGTMMQGAVTRPIEPISSATGTTVSLVPDEYFYNGIAILPTRPIQGNPTVTASFIFVSERKIVDVGGITRPVSGTSTLGYSAVLPTSPIIIREPLSARTYFCPFNFGKLTVQKGYENITYWPNGWTSNSASSDAFVLVSNVAGSTAWDNNTVIPWSMANPDLRNQAVIEIVNTGQIESYFPNGIVLKPGERLAISELPVTPSNGTSGFYNIVRPLSPLVLNLSTNYGYDKTLEKFLKCRYRISFLNFKLYNKNGTFSNKIANNSINFEDTVIKTEIRQGVFTGIVKPRFLLTRYGKEVWVPSSSSGSINCNFWSSIKQLRYFYSRRYAYIQGITMTASIDSPIDTCTFVEFGDLPPNVPGLTNNWASCGDFTIY